MSKFTKSEIAAVLPLRNLETYTVKLKIHTEEGDTKWLNVPVDRIEEFLKSVENF